MTKFKVGDKVQWTSQGGGHYTIKHGTVVRVVKRDDDFLWRIAGKEFPDHYRMFDGWTFLGGKKTKEAYFVEVIKDKRKLLYRPHPDKLRSDDEQIPRE